MIVLYYVVDQHDDTRHATRDNPHTTHHPHRPVTTLCGHTLHVALPSDDRAAPATRLPNGDNPFCPHCVWHDTCLPGTVHRILTTENWRLHTPPHREQQPHNDAIGTDDEAEPARPEHRSPDPTPRQPHHPTNEPQTEREPTTHTPPAHTPKTADHSNPYACSARWHTKATHYSAPTPPRTTFAAC